MRGALVAGVAVVVATLVVPIRVEANAGISSCDPTDPVAFLDGPRQVWKVSPTGGPPIAVTDPQTANRSAVLSPDGTKLAQYGQTDHVVVRSLVPGGPDTFIAASGRVSSVAWSPDGTRLAYVVAVDDSEKPARTMWVSPADGGTPPVAVSQPGYAADSFTWSPDSARLLYRSNGGFSFVRAADASTPPINVSFGMFGFGHVWSPDGSRFAFLTGTLPKKVQVAAFDGSGMVTVGTGWSDQATLAWRPDSSRVYWDGVSAPADASAAPVAFVPSGHTAPSVVSFSPTGTRMAFQTTSPAAKKIFWTSAPDGSAAAQLTPDDQVPTQFAWSPDGASIAFARSLSPVQAVGVFVRAADGSGASIAVSPNAVAVDNVFFDRPGTHVVYKATISGASNLWSAPASGSTSPQALLDPTTLAIPLSPNANAVDGSILFQPTGRRPIKSLWLAEPPFDRLSERVGGPVAMDAYTDEPRYIVASPDRRHLAWAEGGSVVISRAGRALVTTLTAGAAGSRVIELAWSPDGSRLAWISQVGSGGRTVFVALAAGTAPAVPLGPESYSSGLAWSPDGTRLAFQRASTPSVMVADPSVAMSAVAVGNGLKPVWSSDNHSLAVINGTEPTEVDKIDTSSGGAVTVLGHTDGRAESLAWSPDGQQLAAGSRVHTPTFGNDGDETSALHVFAADGSHGSRVGDGLFATWSPDGTHLAWEDWRAHFSAGSFPFFFNFFENQRTTGHVARSDGSNARVIAGAASPQSVALFAASSPLRFSADGSAVAFADVVVAVEGAPVPRPAAASELYRFPYHLENDCTADPSGYRGLATPSRVLDTRVGVGAPLARVGPGEHIDVPVTGASGVPADAAAVVINLTAVDPSTATHLTAGPTGAPLPPTSNLNLPAGDTRPNLAIVPVGAGGKITITNTSGTVDIVGDVSGWVQSPPSGGGGGVGPSNVAQLPRVYRPVAPTRVLDTRSGIGAERKRVGPNSDLVIDAITASGAPADAAAVVVNLTAVAPSDATHITAYAYGRPLPAASNVNLPAGAVRSNLAVVTLGDLSLMTLHNNAGTVDLVADVVGFLALPNAYESIGVRTVPSARILDTRDGTGVSAAGTVGPGGVVTVDVAGHGGVPANARAVIVNITGVLPSAGTHVTAWAADATMPATSSLNLPAGVTVASLAFVELSADGKMKLFNNAGQIDLVADIVGYAA